MTWAHTNRSIRDKRKINTFGKNILRESSIGLRYLSNYLSVSLCLQYKTVSARLTTLLGRMYWAMCIHMWIRWVLSVWFEKATQCNKPVDGGNKREGSGWWGGGLLQSDIASMGTANKGARRNKLMPSQCDPGGCGASWRAEAYGRARGKVVKLGPNAQRPSPSARLHTVTKLNSPTLSHSFSPSFHKHITITITHLRLPSYHNGVRSPTSVTALNWSILLPIHSLHATRRTSRYTWLYVN